MQSKNSVSVMDFAAVACDDKVLLILSIEVGPKTNTYEFLEILSDGLLLWIRGNYYSNKFMLFQDSVISYSSVKSLETDIRQRFCNLDTK